MCKFNNRLFNFALVILAVVEVTLTSPTYRDLKKKTFEYYDEYDQNYDLHYDQRQNGTENYRINLNGFLIAFPGEEVLNKSNVVAVLEHLNLSEDDLFNLFDNYDEDPSAIEELHGIDEAIHHGSENLNTPTVVQLNNFIRNNSTATKNSERRTATKAAKPKKSYRPRPNFVRFLKLIRRNLS